MNSREVVVQPEGSNPVTMIAEPWSLAKLIGFRFACVFFIPAVLGIPLSVHSRVAEVWSGVYERAVDGPLDWLVQNWLGPRVLHMTPVFAGPASPAWYMHWLLIVLIAAVVALVWSVLDRRRPDYRLLHAWLCMLLRVFLGSVLLG